MSFRPFELTIAARTGKELVPYLKRHLTAAHGLLKPALREMSVAIVGTATMSRLHRDFMQIAGPTDVLTFELEHDQRGRVISGEVVVCLPVATRQARQRKIQPRVELLLYALHGMLHLCGFDDKNDMSFSKMHRKEDYILSQLGVGSVFYGRSKRPGNGQGL